MKLENYEVHLPSYSIGNTIYNKIGPVCESYGKTVLVIGGKLALEAAYDKIKAVVDKTNLTSEKNCSGRTVPTRLWRRSGRCRSITRQTWSLVSAAEKRWIP